mmetsp:Transcript_36653/g.71929  ORF Transcript_36653/g.71929 Transcript_36653/m.71929 type:complete len:132 (-) Transcript_36653:1146-1541(-)
MGHKVATAHQNSQINQTSVHSLEHVVINTKGLRLLLRLNETWSFGLVQDGLKLQYKAVETSRCQGKAQQHYDKVQTSCDCWNTLKSYSTAPNDMSLSSNSLNVLSEAMKKGWLGEKEKSGCRFLMRNWSVE